MFKVGDSVVCISRRTMANDIKEGRVYQVVEIDSDSIVIIDDKEVLCDYFSERFRLATLLEKELAE